LWSSYLLASYGMAKKVKYAAQVYQISMEISALDVRI
jgi:hypothetical protein